MKCIKCNLRTKIKKNSEQITLISCVMGIDNFFLTLSD